jgi:hypothetical protein
MLTAWTVRVEMNLLRHILRLCHSAWINTFFILPFRSSTWPLSCSGGCTKAVNIFWGVGLAVTATPTTCTPPAAIASHGHRTGNIVSSATCTPSFHPDAERKQQVTPQLLAEPGSFADQAAAAQDQQQKKNEDESMAAPEGEDGERQKNGHTGTKAGKSQSADVHGTSAVAEDMRDVEQAEGKDRKRHATEQAAIPRDGFNTDQHLDATMEAVECATGADPGRSTCSFLRPARI